MSKATIERFARLGWPPIFLSAIVVITWAAVEASGDIFYQNELQRMFIRLMIILALQMFSGNSGVLSFGHVAFMAMGAYTSALLTIPTEIKKFSFLSMPHWLSSWIFPSQLAGSAQPFNVGFIPGIDDTLAGAGFALVLALVFGIPIVRLTGVAAGIATLAVLVAMNVFISQTSSITRGTSTQIGVPETTTMLSTTLWVVVILVFVYVFKQSRFGLRLRASRENERAAKSVGVNIARERYVAFALSGFIAGIAGAQFGHAFGGTFAYTDFYFDVTFITIAMLIVGGMASVTGAVVGCYFLTAVYIAFQRGEVVGIGGTKFPSATADLVLAVALLAALILRPRGLTAGKEIAWPTDWTLEPVRKLLRGEIRPSFEVPDFLKALGGRKP